MTRTILARKTKGLDVLPMAKSRNNSWWLGQLNWGPQTLSNKNALLAISFSHDWVISLQGRLQLANQMPLYKKGEMPRTSVWCRVLRLSGVWSWQSRWPFGILPWTHRVSNCVCVSKMPWCVLDVCNSPVHIIYHKPHFILYYPCKMPLRKWSVKASSSIYYCLVKQHECSWIDMFVKEAPLQTLSN